MFVSNIMCSISKLSKLKVTILCVYCLVAFARRLFPMEAQVAMEIAQMKGTCEFIGSSLEPDRHTGAKRTSLDVKIEPFKILEEHKSRLIALSKTGMDSQPLHLLFINKEQN